MITLESTYKSTIDGHIETFPGENEERHARIRARERGPFLGWSDGGVNEDNFPSYSRFSRTTFYSPQRTDSARENPFIQSASLKHGVTSASQKTQSSAQAAANVKEVSKAKPYSAIDAAIARFREEHDEKQTNDGKVKASEATVTDQSSQPEAVVSRYLPSILQVNKESRSLGLERFTLTLDEQRDGRPIYIDYSRDALHLRDIRTLKVLCSRKRDVATDNIDPYLRFMNGISAKPEPETSEERNDTEQNLRILSFAQVMTDCEMISSPLIARFRNLQSITLKKRPRKIQADGSMAPYSRGSHKSLNGSRWAYEDTAILEARLKALWAKDDEERGNQATPNKIPKFNFLDDPRLRVHTPSTRVLRSSRMG